MTTPAQKQRRFKNNETNVVEIVASMHGGAPFVSVVPYHVSGTWNRCHMACLLDTDGDEFLLCSLSMSCWGGCKWAVWPRKLVFHLCPLSLPVGPDCFQIALFFPCQWRNTYIHVCFT